MKIKITQVKSFFVFLFFLTLNSWGQEVLTYSAGFESSEGFSTGSTYNNTTVAYNGPSGQQWGTFYGTPSTTSPITGSSSMQMRWYTTASANLGYTFMNFDIANLSKVTFNAKNTTGINVIVSYSTDGGLNYVGDQTFVLSTTSTNYEYIVSATGEYTNVRLKFALTFSTTPTTTSRLYIDDVDVYSVVSSPTITTNNYELPNFGFQDELTYSTSQSFLASGLNLTNNVTVTAPSSNFEVSLDNTTFSNSVSIVPTSGSFTDVPVYVRFYPQSSGTKSGNVTLSSSGASDQYVTVIGTGVVPQLAAPIANAATSITSSSFVASWSAVSGVSNYVIDVSTSPTFTESNGFTTDLIISEYIEGSSNNKYIEIYNGTGSDVDLSDYELQLFSNGSSSASTTNSLTGILTTGSTIVYKNSSAVIYSGTATNASVVGFNGDDAVALYKVSTSAFVDIFGVIGVDPGSSWDDGAISTSNQTLVRNSNVFGGVTTNPAAFTTLGTQWTSYSIDDATYLGSHSFDGGLTPSFVTGYNNQSTGNATSIMVTGLTQGTTYYYRVRAVGINTSENSNVISLTTDFTSVTWNGTSWTNVTGPTNTLEAVIEGVYNTNANGGFNAKNIIVNSGSLTISSNTTVEIQDDLVNNLAASAVVVENNGVLKQVNNIANTGVITVKRNSSDMLRLDYTAWSSPVVGQNILAFSPLTLVNRFYEYLPSTNVYNSVVPSTTDFSVGKGLLIRSPNNWSSTTAAPFMGEFIGVPTNGNVLAPILTGHNLLGNPYASPVNIASIMSNANNSLRTNGTFYFWTNTNPPVNGSYQSSTTNYATYNSASSTGVAASNATEQPDGTIQVGQGFITYAVLAGNLELDNSMRMGTTNGQFFKNSSTNEVNRIWLDLTSANASHNQIAVVYSTNGLNGIDSGDSQIFGNTNSVLYSTISNGKYVIQSRALPFVTSDIVPLGMIAQVAGQYTIALNNFDGLFASQDIYLRDNLLNITHDLKGSSYTFASDSGEFNSRFEIIYTGALAVEAPTMTENSVVVYNDEFGININAGQTIIDTVKIFDVRGRLLMSKTLVNSSTVTLEFESITSQVFVVQITSVDGSTISKKVVN